MPVENASSEFPGSLRRLALKAKGALGLGERPGGRWVGWKDGRGCSQIQEAVRQWGIPHLLPTAAGSCGNQESKAWPLSSVGTQWLSPITCKEFLQTIKSQTSVCSAAHCQCTPACSELSCTCTCVHIGHMTLGTVLVSSGRHTQVAQPSCPEH